MMLIGMVLWTPKSYIVFELVHLYLRLLENVLPCKFHQHWTLQDAILFFMIVVRKICISSVKQLYMMATPEIIHTI